jgi:hypothetical protein
MRHKDPDTEAFDPMEPSDLDELEKLKTLPGWTKYIHRLTEKIVVQSTLATGKGDTEWEKGSLYGLREAEETLDEMIAEASGTPQKDSINRSLALRREHID